ncbi:hypothetical protein LH51_11650 [Nitrincola sp. A-D6]|uniref:UDP-4-amino-4, 6-dideoxy-N-acetyl-beta-L-altrosamine N-acetyltransferase n=1 Tax=Nitrincola sp. A-D6 TaxID=1545442 RepID=UPI00051FAA9C|nr:UDP-4-amino-4,6-dideoxy-N-acetyl-beta-L-altrosamine N-acetyltransferase [Nitrincola sp. A-D6]KGK41844.1 hypothetical protein LH51_11650 [Nitrincola sp. A-D6]
MPPVKAPHSLFCPLDTSLLETVRLWRNKPRIRKNMLNSQPISHDEQQQWFKNLQQIDTKRYLVFFQNLRPVGMLYFDYIGSERLNWGCYLGEEDIWPGSGLILEIAALDYAFDILQQKTLTAEILDHNEQPIRMHIFFEYQEKAPIAFSKNGELIQLRKFQYEATDWKKNREAVIAKLPTSIRLASENITFDY